MSETIEQVKKDLEFLESKGYYPKRLASSLTDTLKSLLTTIESQKEEIEKLIAERTENESIIKRKLAIKQAAVDEAMTTVESLKAITELAVKGLKEIMLIAPMESEAFTHASKILWDMKELSDAKT